MGELTPITPRERLVVLDVLRGFALLGVLLANLYELYSFRLAHWERPVTTLDIAARSFIDIVVKSKAQTLLTFLFGFGFAMQLLRADERGEPIVPLYLRRMFALLAIGWLHVLLLAWLDVTWGYALVGFSLIAFVRTSNRTRLVVAAICTLVPTIVYTFPAVWETLEHLMFSRDRGAYIADYVAAARSGDRLAIAHHHAIMGLLWMFGGGVAWYIPWLLGRFLIGFVAGAQRWFERNGADHLPLFHKLFGFGALAAAPPIVIGTLARLGILGRDHSFAVTLVVRVLEELGLAGQTAMYVAIVVILFQRPAWRRIFGVLAPVGRMPLTTYLMQSLICTSLFYGWGLGWNTPSHAASVGLGFAIFAVQIAFAHLWLRVFRFGPAEWLWRTVVYWKPQPMLASSASTSRTV